MSDLRKLYHVFYSQHFIFRSSFLTEIVLFGERNFKLCILVYIQVATPRLQYFFYIYKGRARVLDFSKGLPQ